MTFFLKIHILLLTLSYVIFAKCKTETDYTEEYSEYDNFSYSAHDDHIFEEEEEIEYKEMPKDCKFLQYFVLKRKCNDLYPEDVADIYRDPFVSAHDQYAVFEFIDDGVKNYFLTFHHSALFHCDEIEVKDVINFICTNSLGVHYNVKLKSGYMQCLTYKSDMVDELLTACSSDLNRSSNFTALHYANILPDLRAKCNLNAMQYRWLLLGLVALVISIEYLQLIL